jgi:hypothetical protein
MIPLRSRSDSFTFTPELSAIASGSNFSRCPKDYSATALAPQSYAKEHDENHIKPELVNSLRGEGLTGNIRADALFGEAAISAASQDMSAQNIRERLYEGVRIFEHRKNPQRGIERAMQCA